MNIPSMPTDNLYKFISIFGIILLISNIALFVYDAVNRDRQNLEYEVQKYRIINDNLAISLDIGFKKQEKQTENTAKYIFAKERGRDIINVEYWKINMIESQNLRNRYTFWVASLIICLFSIWLIDYGFKMWKIKLQVYQDEIIKNEAERSKIKEEPRKNLTTGESDGS